MRNVHTVLATAAVLLTPLAADAQLRYTWADLSGNPISATSVNGIGSTVTLRLYVQDASAGATVFGSQGGLGTAAVRVTASQSGAGVISGTPGIGNPGWEFGNTNGSNPTSSVTLNVFNFSAGRTPDAGGRVLLGTVTLRGDAAGTYNISASDPNPASLGDVTLFLNGQSLDSLGPAEIQFAVVPVPEPVGLLAVAGIGAGVALRRRGKRRSV